MQIKNPTKTAARRPVAWLAFLTLCFLAVGIPLIGTGCKPPPPPPPPAPPPPPPPPPPLTQRQVSDRLRPFFYLLNDCAFNADAISSPDRRPAGNADAVASTPALDEFAKLLGEDGGVPAPQITSWANFLKGRNKDARGCLLNIFISQALKDYDGGSLHRSHVYLRDVMGLAGEYQGEAGLGNRGSEYLKQFFLEIPDDLRLEAFARQFETFVSVQEEKILLHGRHAAVLNAAGLTDAAEFTRSKLVTQFDLVTTPLINKAIERGESYGFRPPAQLQATRKRLASHAAVLNECRPKAGEKSFCTEAVLGGVDPKYRDQLTIFEKAWAAGNRNDNDKNAQPNVKSIERQVRELWQFKRPISEWLKEKELCFENCPSFLVNPEFVSLAYVEAASPVAYLADENKFTVDNVGRLVRDANRVKSVAQWCASGNLPVELKDGSGHLLLAWYWLECDRSDLARSALLDGADYLLETVRSVDIESLRSSTGGNAAEMTKVLVAELNAYRMLMAASMITTCPPGAFNDSRDSFQSQLQVLFLGWRQSWLKCGLPQTPADEIYRRFSDIGQDNAMGLYRTVSDDRSAALDRYFFFDYRFGYDGTVPDVVVEKAMKERLVEDGEVSKLTADSLLKFFGSFPRPTEFPSGFADRWRSQQDEQKNKRAE